MKILIVGGGISGCAMAWTLHQRGIDFEWLDGINASSPSRVAAGIITPVVPKRFALTWQHNIVLPIAHAFYNNLVPLLKKPFYNARTNILVAESAEQMNDWLVKTDNPQFAPYIEAIHKPDSLPLLHASFGAIEITGAAVIDTPAFIEATHAFFMMKICFSDLVELEAETLKRLVLNFECDKTILCTGWYAGNADTNILPFNPAKGETITIDIEEGFGALENIIQKHVYIAPITGTTLKVGATYEWESLDGNITKEARHHLVKEAFELLNVPFSVTGQSAAVRPATHARRPLVGHYPGMVDVFVLNGMGTKGLLLAPWCAQQLADYILEGTPIHIEIDAMLQRRH